MKLAKYVFLIGGIYGLFATVPLYFSEGTFAIDYPPAINHPEYFYAFAGVTAAWQILFIMISRNPVRYRTLMIPCMLEKSAMVLTFCILFPQGRFPQLWILPGSIDVILGVLFFVAYVKTKHLPESSASPVTSK